MLQLKINHGPGLGFSRAGWRLNTPACNVHRRNARQFRSQQLRCSSEFVGNTQNATTPEAWNQISKALVREGMKLVTSEQLLAAQGSGAKVIDVRPTSAWEEEHVPDSMSVQLYRPIEGWSAMKIAKRMSYAAFGVFDGTEINDRFMEEIAEVAEKTDPIVLVCNMGGSLDKSLYFDHGQPTRSLIAAYELIRNGYQDVKVYKGGITGWNAEGRQFYTMNYEEEGEE